MIDQKLLNLTLPTDKNRNVDPVKNNRYLDIQLTKPKP